MQSDVALIREEGALWINIQYGNQFEIVQASFAMPNDPTNEHDTANCKRQCSGVSSQESVVIGWYSTTSDL